MTVFEIQSPKGKTYEIEAETMPSEAQLRSLLLKMEPEEAKPQNEAQNRFMVNPGPALDVAGRFATGAGNRLASNLNPLSMLHGIGSAISDIPGTAKNLVDAQSRGFINAWDLAGEGRTVEALGQAVSGALPILGPLARASGERAGETGDLAGAIGEGLADAATGKLLSKVPSLPVGRVTAPIASGIRKAAPIVGKVAKEVAPELGAAAAGSAAGMVVGGPVGAMAGSAMGAGAGRIVKNAVVKVLRREKNLSQADAVKAVDSLPVEKVEAIKAANPSRFDQKRPVVLDPRYDWVTGSDGVTLPRAKAGQYPESFYQTPVIKPIPPSKSPVRPPDPEVPELTMKERAVQKFEQAKAARNSPKGDVVEAPPAFPGQQGAKGATDARFKEIAARNVKSMIEAGSKDAFIISKLRSVFKMSTEDAEALVREVGGKSNGSR